ncbi:HOOK protein-domain-containing protein, partial [Linnemannia elongata]
YREEISVDQELAQLHQSRDELERGNQSLMQELANMNRKYDELLTEKEELKQRIRDLEKASAHASQSGKSDFLMRTEIDHLRQDLRKSEDRRQEQEILINNQLKAISDLSRAVSNRAQRKNADEAVRLKDKLDEYKHAIDKLQKTENVIEKYKKKLEEGADLRRQMKVLEDQNTELLDRNKEVEGEYRKVLAFKSLMESYKEQIQTLEDKNSSLAKEKNKIEYEARLQNQQFQQIEADRTRDSEQIQLLEDKIRELEFSGVHQGTPLSSDLQDMETDDMESSMMNRTAQTTELKLTISRLEREIQSLREETQDEGGSKATVLQHLLDDANKSKAKFEQDYLEEHQAKIILQSELDRIRGGKGDESEVAFTLRSTLNSCEKELSETKKTLAEMETNLEQTKKELVIEFLALQEEYAKLIEKTQSLEAENKHYLSQLNQVLTEKDGLSKLELEQRDRMLQQERAQSGEAQEAHTREQLETKNRHLEQQLEQMTQQMNQYSMKLNRAKEFIVQQDAMIKDGKTKQPAEGYSEAVESLQTELATKEEEVESLKRQMREMEIQVRREQQLMTSAWHDQLRKGIRDNVISQHQRIAPTSWLGVQRRVFSAQLGVRH